MAKPTGYVLWESEEIVCILTLNSGNIKTGNMVQTWILTKRINPMEAVWFGGDELTCGDCPRRPRIAKEKGLTPCYVNVAKAPRNVWRCWSEGKYPPAYEAGCIRLELIQRLQGRQFRLGAYGDPAFVPYEVWSDILQFVDGWTGYTHQWRKLPREWTTLVMASCDNNQDCVDATAAGWSYFYVRENETQEPPAGVLHFQCPAAKEAHNGEVTCSKCMLCNGTQPYRGVARQKGIYIYAH